MLEVAWARAAGRENVSFPEADAASHVFHGPGADLVFSKFGVMFFADPEAAFANLHRAAKPGGRLAFICWRPMAENPFAGAADPGGAQGICRLSPCPIRRPPARSLSPTPSWSAMHPDAGRLQDAGLR